ncbi:hypothetical protein [Bythopirellula goksoeyrii]|uniref:Uncharacterized protein n=1 Tax=Bythopirellula goksoeyrii TaxID=1400387 RepID=A0A5B9QJK3_9BACT|nr:hypothetical protein [Bythopirellula goksoeyrii]QEG34341.1 hypothetical protein Pr1d_16160 [Bythopirellula goksoeyrii]
MEPVVDIAFDCLPLRSIGRLDAPLDAPAEYRRRHEQLVSAMERFGPDRTYFLYNARCVFHLANSEIEGMVRYEFDGIIRTDASDLLTETVELDARLASETCGGLPDQVETWFKDRVEKAVAIEFDRFVAAGQLSQRSSELGQDVNPSNLAGFSGMGV